MKKLFNKYSILTLLFAFMVISCDEGFEDLNKNPNSPNEVPADLLLGKMQFDLANNMYSTFVGGDMGACWAQQWSKIQYNDEERFAPRPGVIRRFWDRLYADVITEAKAMYNLADASGNNNQKGIALVMQAYAFNLLTDTFGDIPFSEAGDASNGVISPKYDSQSDVYQGIFAMLDEADSLLGTGGAVNVSTDLVYGGDVMKWKKFANSLKFRALVRVSKKMDVSTQLQDLISNRVMFTSVDDNAAFTFKDENPNANPIYETVVFGTRKEWKVSDILVDQLLSDSDPRISQIVGLNADGNYRGKPSGIANVPNDDYNVNNVSPIGPRYLEPTLPGYFMTYSELQFLIAEAITRSDISISAGNADDYYKNGISASFVDSNADLALLPSFLSTKTLTGVEADDLVNIATQNWIALFGQGIESFIEQRRTNTPILPLPIDAYINDFTYRYTYPDTESSVNAANYQEAVTNMGGDALNTKMWRLQP